MAAAEPGGNNLRVTFCKTFALKKILDKAIICLQMAYIFQVRSTAVQGYLAHKKPPPHRTAIGP